MADKRSPEMIAVEAVHTALVPLDAETRKRVLRSVYALLEIVMGDAGGAVVKDTGAGAAAPAVTIDAPVMHATGRPVSIVELIQEKQPGTQAQRIALFAYYREKHEGLARFSRADLQSYFSKAKEPPTTNYGRDFVEAVKKGWLHEDGADSYITSRGIEAVESGFASERKYAKRTKHIVTAKGKSIPRKKAPGRSGAKG